MRKILGRSDFIPLPLRERAGVRGILFLAILIAAGSVAAFGQNNSAGQSSPYHYHAHLTPAQRANLERKAQGLYDVIKAPDWGQRSDHDQYVILSRFLAFSGILSSTPTAHVDEAETLWKKLLDKNPQWKTRPPRDMNVKEYHEAIQKQKDEAKTIEEKAKMWRPLDGAVMVYHHGSFRAIIHPYHVDFFRALEKKPFKIITFGYPVMPIIGWNGVFPRDRKIFVLGRSDSGYQHQTMEEWGIMGKLEQEGKDPRNWVQPNADYKEFYGVISIDGKILARIPFHRHIPGLGLKPIFADPDGHFAAFLIGKMVPPGDEDEVSYWGVSYANISGIIVWTPDKSLRTVSPEEAKREFPILKKWIR